MPPRLPKIYFQALRSLKAYDWSSAIENVLKRLTHTATKSEVIAAVWTRISALFSSNGARFASSWQSVSASALSKKWAYIQPRVGPALSKSASEVVHSFKTHEWFLSATDTCKRLTQALTKLNIRPVVWILGASVSIGMLFAYNRQPIKTGVNPKYVWEQTTKLGRDFSGLLSMAQPGALLGATSSSLGSGLLRIYQDVYDTLSRWYKFICNILPLIIWIVLFVAGILLLPVLGFGAAGVAAGSLAAVFQSVVYGAFTPAGGLFALLTSVGSLGVGSLPVVIPSVLIATLVALII